MLGPVDRRISPEGGMVQPAGTAAFLLAGEAETVLYRLRCEPSDKRGRPLLLQPYFKEGDGSLAAAGICIPNLQDSLGPRERFVKSLFFFPSPSAAEPTKLPIQGPKAFRVWVDSQEIPRPGRGSCETVPPSAPEDETARRESCFREAPRTGPDRRWGIVPVISAGPDKGLGAGVKFRHRGLLNLNQPLEARLLYTMYQYQIAEFWYFAGRFPSRRSGVRLTCNYYNKTRARFYGIGNDTDESDVANFTWQDLDLALVLDHRLSFGLGFLVGWESRWEHIGEGKDSDLPRLADAYPDVFGMEGGWSNGPLLGVYHSTLTPRHDPLSGGMQSFTLRLADDCLGTYTYQQYRLEAIQMIPLPGYAHRIALRGQIQLMGGDPPFSLLSWVGGDDTARGYFEGRHRDKDRILLNAEYRCNLYKFFDGVLFLDTGRVAEDLLAGSPFKDLHVTGGFGMRFHLYPELVVRFDVGFSPEMTAAYLNFGHTF
jgi:hypothetical protein